MSFGTFLVMQNFKEHVFEKQPNDIIKTGASMCQHF